MAKKTCMSLYFDPVPMVIHLRPVPMTIILGLFLAMGYRQPSSARDNYEWEEVVEPALKGSSCDPQVRIM